MMIAAVTSTTGPAVNSPGNSPVLIGLFWMAMALAGLLVLHTLAVWADRRGWIYYRRGGGGAGRALSNALSTFDAMVNPASEHLYEEQKSERAIGQVDETGHLILDDGHEFVIEPERTEGNEPPADR